MREVIELATLTKKSDITRSKILAAAEAEFSDKGIWGARIDEIAKNAGVNKRMIYAHFESKENLYKTVLSDVYSRLAEYEKEYYIEGISPELAISNIVNVSFSFLEKNPNFVRMLMWENLNGAKYVDNSELSNIKNPTIQYIKNQIRRGKESGVFRQDIDEQQIVVSLMNFEFSYFSNIHTLSRILSIDLSLPQEIHKRSAFISDMLLKYLMG